MPLGISPHQEYGELKLQIELGTTLTVCTDGITESMNPSNELFGRVRLENFIAANAAPAEQLVKAIVAEVDQFCGTRPQRDDMCLVCVRRVPEPPASRADDTTDVS